MKTRTPLARNLCATCPNRQPDAELVALLARAVESRIDDKWIKDVREVLKKRQHEND